MYDGSVITVVDMVDTMMTSTKKVRSADASRKNSVAVLCLASTDSNSDQILIVETENTFPNGS